MSFTRPDAKLDPASVELEEGFTRDATNLGHFSPGNLEVRLTGAEDVLRAEPLLTASYEVG